MSRGISSLKAKLDQLAYSGSLLTARWPPVGRSGVRLGTGREAAATTGSLKLCLMNLKAKLWRILMRRNLCGDQSMKGGSWV